MLRTHVLPPLWALHAGICDQTQFNVLGDREDEMRSILIAQTEAVDIWEATKQGEIDEVQLVVAFLPERLTDKDWSGASLLHMC